jgi:integrase
MVINKIVAKAGRRAGITNPNTRLKHINPHIARHLQNKGFSAEWIQNFLGYVSYKTTMDMYGTLSIDEMQQEAEKRLQELLHILENL